MHLGRRATQRLSAARALDEAPGHRPLRHRSRAASPPPMSLNRPRLRLRAAAAPASRTGPVAWSPTATVNPSRASGVFGGCAASRCRSRRASRIAGRGGTGKTACEIEKCAAHTARIALRDIGAVAEVVAGLDRSLGKIRIRRSRRRSVKWRGRLRRAIVERWWRAWEKRGCRQPSVPSRARVVPWGRVRGLVVDAYLHAPRSGAKRIAPRCERRVSERWSCCRADREQGPRGGRCGRRVFG